MAQHNGPAMYQKVVLLLKDGPTTPESIMKAFKGSTSDHLMYRLSVYLHTIKKRGGVIKVVKNGRSVISYELLNANKFDTFGKFIKE